MDADDVVYGVASLLEAALVVRCWKTFAAVVAVIVLVVGGFYLLASQMDHAKERTRLAPVAESPSHLPPVMGVTGQMGSYDVLENAEVACYAKDRDLYCSRK